MHSMFFLEYGMTDETNNLIAMCIGYLKYNECDDHLDGGDYENYLNICYKAATKKTRTESPFCDANVLDDQERNRTGWIQ